MLKLSFFLIFVVKLNKCYAFILIKLYNTTNLFKWFDINFLNKDIFVIFLAINSFIHNKLCMYAWYFCYHDNDYLTLMKFERNFIKIINISLLINHLKSLFFSLNIINLLIIFVEMTHYFFKGSPLREWTLYFHSVFLSIHKVMVASNPN